MVTEERKQMSSEYNIQVYNNKYLFFKILHKFNKKKKKIKENIQDIHDNNMYTNLRFCPSNMMVVAPQATSVRSNKAVVEGAFIVTTRLQYSFRNRSPRIYTENIDDPSRLENGR